MSGKNTRPIDWEKREKQSLVGRSFYPSFPRGVARPYFAGKLRVTFTRGEKRGKNLLQIMALPLREKIGETRGKPANFTIFPKRRNATYFNRLSVSHRE